MKRVTTIVAAATVALALSATAAAAPGSTEPTDSASTPSDPAELYPPQPLGETTELTVAVSGSVMAFLPVLLADELGEFDKENLDVSFEILPATDSIVLLERGDVDAVASAFNAGVLNLIAGGSEVRLVFPYEPASPEGSGAGGFWVRDDVVGDDGFQPSDLLGEPIATSSGAQSPSLAYLWLNVLNADDEFPMSELNAQTVALADTPIALENGSIAAGLVHAPFHSVVDESGCCQYIDGSDVPFPQGWVLAGPSLLEDDPEAGAALLRAMARTAATYLLGDFMQDPEVGPLVAEVLEQPLEDLQVVGPDNVWDPEFPVDLDGLMDLQEYYSQLPEALQYDEPLAADDVFDLSLFDAALGR